MAGAHSNVRMLKGRLHGAEGMVRYCPCPGETGNRHWFLTGNNSASPGLLRAAFSCGQKVTRNRRLRCWYRKASIHHYTLVLLIALAHSRARDSDPQHLGTLAETDDDCWQPEIKKESLNTKQVCA